MRPLHLVAAMLAALAAHHPASAQSSDPGTPYELLDPSSFDTGCYGPCDCAVLQTKLEGSFRLRFTGHDPLYSNYEVLDVKWITPREDRRVEIRGSGRYRIGGEVALMHELDLDLSVDGQPSQHFGSGLVPGGGGFPKIDIEVSIHGMQACMDTVIHVVAAPANAGTPSGPLRSGLGHVSPNPFSETMQIELATAGIGSVDARVYDALGREQRTLTSGWLPAGRRSLLWDGRTEDGAECPAGVYFIVARGAAWNDSRRLVKLR